VVSRRADLLTALILVLFEKLIFAASSIVLFLCGAEADGGGGVWHVPRSNVCV